MGTSQMARSTSLSLQCDSNLCFFFILRMVFLKTGKLENMISYGYTYNFLACYTGAVGIFLAFAKSKAGGVLERFRRPIEQISGASFGVYLIMSI